MQTQNTSTPAEQAIEEPRLHAFAERATAILSEGGRDAFQQCQPHFMELLRSSVLREVVNHQLATFIRDPTYIPKLTSSTQMMLLRSSLFDLSVRIFNPSQGVETHLLHDATEHCFIGNVGPGSLELTMFHQPAPYPHDVLDRSKRLVENGVQVLAPGGMYTLRAFEDVPLVRVLDEGPCVVLIFRSSSEMGICWEYERETLLPRRMVAADLTPFRLEHTTWVLAALNDRSSIPALARLTEHPVHYVRWAALRALLRIDEKEGLPLLRRAKDDPHPYIRKAAGRALESLDMLRLPFQTIP